MKIFKHYLKTGLVILAGLSLVACFHGEDDDEVEMSDATYKVTISNITSAQPLTPVAIVVHKPGFSGWTLGGAASNGLEKLAESGDTIDFIMDAAANINVSSTNVAGTAPFGPGEVASADITTTHSNDLEMSFASMLANTNDAFTGMTSVEIGAMSVGDSMTLMSYVYDAGTEANTESAGTLAGPVDTLMLEDKAYSATRDDLHNFVTVHAGVVSMDDGLTASILDESHRWNGPAAKIVIERL